MDLSSPISSVIPTAHGAVLAVLARTDQPLSGRQVAVLTKGRFGQWRVNEVLGQLSDAGIVVREHRPPAKLYRLNRDHVAAAGIEALASQREELLSRISGVVASWAVAAEAVWLFGSAARGDGDVSSDIDLLVVRPDDVDADGPVWLRQLDGVAEQVRLWSGNRCEILELSHAELTAMVPAASVWWTSSAPMLSWLVARRRGACFASHARRRRRERVDGRTSTPRQGPRVPGSGRGQP